MARKSNGKRKMTALQEFEIMKLVLDKFLWLGFIVMGWGMYLTIRDAAILPGLWYMLGGAVLLLLFLIIIVKEYEIIK
ncbi:hypothetical protein COV20_00395 [Candidatus Woesearchaeota archaeon CG10_big_fil_rev_8_21_14_0_10_45_16]|nr:MAG: hypothetical protein COV20_00395 [Candidatus Woesearchaeota archaeon CG10_big_fil_rev_8_21_14_0_10_45_16]